MDSNKIRQEFLNFFEKKSHEVVESAPMVLKNDPTLMFTNAGMNQFKDIFLGNKPAKNPRVVNSQKCLRVSGKHNDLEEVGVDTYHHTMFEMLGNWSFGEYFKKEAILWAWELLTEVYKIEKDKLYITVFGGDEKDKLGIDEESYNIWKEIVPEDRIIKAGKKDNFWEMGEVGPCGPCSEIHIDIRRTEEKAKVDGRSLVNEDHPQVIEIWNLVFMEFNRKANRSLVPLPHKHVDTGMGLERLCVALQGKTSNYDTDLFTPLIYELEKMSGVSYGHSEKTDIALRVITDHLRAVAFAICDGQLPSNTGAGYVIRRILRRAVRYGYSFLNLRDSFIYSLVPVLVDIMGDHFKGLKEQQDLITKVIKEEEESFLRTLEKGINRFNEYAGKGQSRIEGKFAFELYDTFGFPIDLTELMAREQELEVDMVGFNVALKVQKDRSRAAGKIETEDWVELYKDDVEEFVGYDNLETTVKITKYRKIKIKGKERYQLVFNITPFYAEGGGQVGDTGYIEANDEKVFILDTKKENELIIHFTDKLPGYPELEFKAVVNEEKRRLTAHNHSATHLLHKALRDVLGTHVEQKGSLVNEKHLRFDFSHFQKVTEEDLLKIEEQVNSKIRENITLNEHRSIPIKEAMEKGAIALFGEKYGDMVRMIKFGDSVELCGGTHVNATGEIGLFKLISESSVAAGIRRIEAITSKRADEYVNDQINLLDDVKDLMKHPKDLKKAIIDLQEENSRLNKELEAFIKEKAKDVKAELIKEITEVNGVKFLSKKVALDPGAIKDIAFQLKGEFDDLFLVLGTESKGKPNISVMVADKLVAEKSMNAGTIVRELAKEIQGGGGGQAFFATAGGNNINGLDAAIAKAKEMI